MSRTNILLLIAVALLALASCSSQEKKWTNLFLISQDGLYGYIDGAGKVIIKPQFYNAKDFSEGMAAIIPATDSGSTLWSYIDETGEIVIKNQEESFPFSEGLLRVKMNDKYGYVDKRGANAIPTTFDWADDFSEGLASVVIGSEKGYIDKTGQIVIRHQAKGAWKFSEGLARVYFFGDGGGFIDKAGKIAINRIGEDFSDGLSLVGDITSKTGFMDRTGKTVIESKFDLAEPFSDGLAQVFVKTSYGYKYGYIDRSGTIVVPPEFDDPCGNCPLDSRFSEGLAAASLGPKGGFVSNTGAVVSDPDPYREIKSHDGITRTHGIGYIDKTGRFVIKPQFKSAEPFSGGLARVGDGEKFGYIDKTGKYIWNPTK